MHLQVDVGINEAVGEHTTLGQESTVVVQIVQGLVQAVAHGGDLRVFFWRQVVEILGGGFARMDLVLHAIKARHQHGTEAQIRIAQRIGETALDASALGVGHVRDADRCRPVACAVGQLHRGLKTRHQTLVAVGARVGDGVQCTRVFDDAADVVQGKVRQACVTVTSKEVLAVFPHRLVHVHAAAVVAHDRLGHESGRFAIGMRHVVDHILLQLAPVGALHQGAELGTEFLLALASHFMVMHFNRNTQRFENQAHL